MHAGLFELQPKRREIVDLAVEGDPPAAIAADEGLQAGVGGVDNREPLLAEHRTAFGVAPDAIAIGTAMADAVGHRLYDGFGDRTFKRLPAGQNETRDSTHELDPEK